MKLFIFIAAISLIVSCKKYVPAAERIEDDFVLSVSDTTGLRNDARSTFKVKLANTKAIKDGMKVNFQTSKGGLLLNDIKFENHSAEGIIKVDQDTGTYIIKAFLKEGDAVKVEKVLYVNFRRAAADSIGIELDRTLYSLSTPVTIRTFLYRNTGLITRGAKVFFRAVQLNASNDTVNAGRFEGVFSNYSDANGRLADVKLFTEIPVVDTPRVLFIQAKTLNDQGDTIRRMLSLKFH